MDERWQMVCDLAEGQHGAFATAQVRELGIDSGWLTRAERDRRICRIFRGAYGVIGLLDDWTVMAATQLVVPRSVATARAGAVLHGFDGVDVLAMDVLVPRSANWRGPLVTRTDDLVVPEIVIVDGLRCTDEVRTLIELGRLVDMHALERAIASLLARRPEAEPLLLDRARALARRGKSGPRAVLTILGVRSWAAVLRGETNESVVVARV